MRAHLKLCVFLLGSLLALSTFSSPAAAQLSDRPVPKDKPIGIVYQSEVGKVTQRSAADDALNQVVFAEVEQSLRRLGYEVMPRSVVLQKLVATDLDCPGGLSNCEPAEVLEALQLGAVVLVAIW